MNSPINLNQCLTYINCQLQGPKRPLNLHAEGQRRRVVTISRLAGSGAHEVASELAQILSHRSPEGSCPWTVFDRNLVEKVLEDHKLPARLAKFMPEDRISGFSDTLDELFGLHPPSSQLMRDMAETVLRLADLGSVIFIGRAANLITAKLDYVFNVRLVGSVKRRLEYLRRVLSLDEKSALALMDSEDVGRKRFIKKYYQGDIDDPLLYHLIINTDLVTFKEAAQIIADQVIPAPAPAKRHHEMPVPA